MKILFFAEEYPGFRGTEAEKALLGCGVRYFIVGRGIDMVAVLVEDERQEGCVYKVLDLAGVRYVFEMVGAPRVLRYRSVVTGRVLAEMQFS
jgi:hypothetical protein